MPPRSRASRAPACSMRCRKISCARPAQRPQRICGGAPPRAADCLVAGRFVSRSSGRGNSYRLRRGRTHLRHSRAWAGTLCKSALQRDYTVSMGLVLLVHAASVHDEFPGRPVVWHSRSARGAESKNVDRSRNQSTSNQPRLCHLPKGVSLGHDAWRRLRRNRMAMLSLVTLITIGLLAFFTPFCRLRRQISITPICNTNRRN